MRHHFTNIQQLAGVTLIETLFASALGAILLITLLNLYQRSVTMHAFAESRTELNETLLTVEHFLVNELQLASLSLCGKTDTTFNLVRANQTTQWLRLFAEPIQITTDDMTDNNVITVLKTGAPVPLASHDLTQSQLVLTHATTFNRGDLIVVCDNTVSVLLQITHTAGSGRFLAYEHHASVRPGNCASPFGVGGCGPEGHRFEHGALVALYQPVSIFISNSDARGSLYIRQLVTINSSNGVTTAKLRSEEIIEGIVALRAWAGVESSSGRIRLTRAPHSGQAVFLDIGLVAISTDHNADTLPHQSLHLFGEPINTELFDNTHHLLTSYEFSVTL